MATNYSPKIITDGLVLALDAANPKSYPGSGTTWFDRSGNGNNGTLVNGPTYSSANNGSIVFDGTNDYAEVPPIKPQALTLSSWFIATNEPASNNDLGGAHLISSNSVYVAPFLPYWLSYSWLNQVCLFGIQANADGYITAPCPRMTILNVVGTFDNINQSIYVNGVLSNTVPRTVVISYPSSGGSALNTQIGRWGFSPFERHFNGNIYSTQIYNRALTAAEVLQNYNATKGRFGL